MRRIAGVVLVVVLAGGGVGIAAAMGAFRAGSGGAASPPTGTTNTTTSTTAGVTPAAGTGTKSSASTTTTTSPTASVSVAVPVVDCPTTWAVVTSPAPAALPTSVTLSVPAQLAGKVALFSDDLGRMKLLGPAGWQCTAAYATDGSGAVEVYPPGRTAPSVRAFTASSTEGIVGSESSACASCTLGQACPLFPAAVTAYADDGYDAAGCRTKPATETTDQLSAGVVAFEDPPGVAGDGAPSGGPYAANGVMTFYPGANVGSVVPTGSWLDTCTLPASTHDLCTAALDLFVTDYGSK